MITHERPTSALYLLRHGQQHRNKARGGNLALLSPEDLQDIAVTEPDDFSAEVTAKGHMQHLLRAARLAIQLTMQGVCTADIQMYSASRRTYLLETEFTKSWLIQHGDHGTKARFPYTRWGFEEQKNGVSDECFAWQHPAFLPSCTKRHERYDGKEGQWNRLTQKPVLLDQAFTPEQREVIYWQKQQKKIHDDTDIYGESLLDTKVRITPDLEAIRLDLETPRENFHLLWLRRNACC